MAGKKRGGKKSVDAAASEEAALAAKSDKAPLQAVVFADSFEERLRPVTFETPKALLPLANVPLIEYTLEFLADSGVKEVFVVCGWLGDQVEAYLSSSRWGRSEDPVVRVLKLRAARNACHALRELDSMDVIRSDPFVLVSGDVVSNIRLGPVLEAHEARRKDDKNNVMTMLFSRVDQVKNRIRPLSEELLLAVDARTKQILKYDNNLDTSRTSFKNGELMDEFPSVEFRYDLLDCNVDICSPEMLLQIAENYDYEDLRRDYVRNEVQNHELGYRIHAHELTSQSDYACRVRCFRTYDAISRDVVRRWLYPLVPDANWSTEKTTYAVERGLRYRDQGVRVARSASIGESCMIGANTEVDEGAAIVTSILGDDCYVGRSAKVSGSYLWGDVSIGEGAIVESAVLCNGVVIGAGAKIGRGSVLSFGVVISANAEVPPFSRITTRSGAADDEAGQDDDSDFGDFSDLEGDDDDSDNASNSKPGAGVGDEDSEEAEHTVEIVGVDGKGYIYTDKERASRFPTPKWARETMKAEHFSDESFLSLSDSMGCHELESAREVLFSGFPSLEEEEEEEEAVVGTVGLNDDARFTRGVADLVNALGSADVIEHDNVLLELNCYKYAENRSFEDLVLATAAIMLAPALAPPPPSKEVAVAKMLKEIKRWHPSLVKLCSDVPQTVALITSLELLLLYGPEHAAGVGLAVQNRVFNQKEAQLSVRKDLEHAQAAFPFILSNLYQEDIISDEAAMKWSELHSTTGVPDVIVNSPVTQLVLSQITEEEEEDSDEEDSDEEDGSDEDGSETEDDE